MKIKVIKIDGSQPSIWNYISRWFFRIFDIYMFSGVVAIVTISINGKGQRLGDIVSGTTVVRSDKNENLDKTIYIELPDNYKCFFEDIRMLEETDIITIKDVLIHYKKNTGLPIAGNLVRKTAQAISSKTGINIENNPLDFLEQIISDYNFINKKI